MNVLLRLWLTVDHLAYRLRNPRAIPPTREANPSFWRNMHVVEPGHVAAGEAETVRSTGIPQLLWRRWSGS